MYFFRLSTGGKEDDEEDSEDRGGSTWKFEKFGVKSILGADVGVGFDWLT